MPAISMLFYWFALQLTGQILTQTASSRMHLGGVAYWAHLGGFVTGLVMMKLIPGRSEYAYRGWTKNDDAAPAPEPSADNASTL